MDDTDPISAWKRIAYKAIRFFNVRCTLVLMQMWPNFFILSTASSLHIVLRYLTIKSEHHFTHESHDKKRIPSLYIQSILDFRFITYWFLWNTTVSTLPIWGFGRPCAWCSSYGLCTIFNLFSDWQCGPIYPFFGTSSLHGLSFFKCYSYLSKLYCVYGCYACTALLDSFYYQLYVRFTGTFCVVSYFCTLA